MSASKPEINRLWGVIYSISHAGGVRVVGGGGGGDPKKKKKNEKNKKKEKKKKIYFKFIKK
ncbi:MAG: hypothetical protein ACFB4J_06280, partial [Elainellaceae cyanobacterium]